YLGGSKSHRMDNDSMVDHIVEQVETKALELEAERREAVATAAE
ncbi:MAG: 4-hydroxy-3-methylbut-2-en-1-yl diphosphate synthase, partial [Pseudomonadota bacterium]